MANQTISGIGNKEVPEEELTNLNLERGLKLLSES